MSEPSHVGCYESDVRNRLQEPIVASGAREFKVSKGKDQNGLPFTMVDLCKCDTVMLTSGMMMLTPAEFVMELVTAQLDRLNFYGSPKPHAS